MNGSAVFAFFVGGDRGERETALSDGDALADGAALAAGADLARVATTADENEVVSCAVRSTHMSSMTGPIPLPTQSWNSHHANQASGLVRHACCKPNQACCMPAADQGEFIHWRATPTEWCRSLVLSLQSDKWRTVYCPELLNDAATTAAHDSAL